MNFIEETGMALSWRMSGFPNPWHRRIWPFVGAAAIAAADQGIKLAVLAAQPRVIVIPGFFAISFTTNTGAAFGLFRPFSGMLTVLGVGILAGLVVYVLRSAATLTRLARAAFALLIGGAAGNVIDRVRLGYVVDYLDVFVGKYHWPAFNLADSAITIAVSLLLFGMFQDRDGKGGNADPAHPEPSGSRTPDQ